MAIVYEVDDQPCHQSDDHEPKQDFAKDSEKTEIGYVGHIRNVRIKIRHPFLGLDFVDLKIRRFEHLLHRFGRICRFSRLHGRRHSKDPQHRDDHCCRRGGQARGHASESQFHIPAFDARAAV